MSQGNTNEGAVLDDRPATKEGLQKSSDSPAVASVVQALADPVSKMISEGPAHGLMMFGGVMLLFTIFAESGVFVLGTGLSDVIAMTIIAVAGTFMVVGALIQMTENARTRQFTADLTRTALQSSQSGNDATLEAIMAANEKRDNVLLEVLRSDQKPRGSWG